MKEIVIEACKLADNKLRDIAAKETKRQVIQLPLDASPYELSDFLKENNVPEDAFFSCTCDIDNYNSGDVVISWRVNVPLTKEEQLAYCANSSRFRQRVWGILYPQLIEMGYKRVGFDTRLLKPFSNTSVIKMYQAEEWDRLEEYFSLFFKI